MAQVTFKLNGKSVLLIIEIVKNILAKLTANVAVYATPNPTVVSITALNDALDAAYQDALHGGKLKKALVRISRKKVLDAMAILQAYVQTTSNGDAVKIMLIADVKKTPSPVGILFPPSDFRSNFGKHFGEIILRWGGVKHRMLYKLQINRTPGDDTKWEDLKDGLTGKNRFIVTGLTSGQNYSFRAATISADGIGGWSDATTHMAY